MIFFSEDEQIFTNIVNRLIYNTAHSHDELLFFRESIPQVFMSLITRLCANFLVLKHARYTRFCVFIICFAMNVISCCKA